MERGSIAKHHNPAWNPQCTQKSRKVLCPKPKVMPHPSVSVIVEKRGGCCRTDGPRRVRSGQMLHTIAAINAACCCSLRSTSSPRASCSASCPQFIANCNKRCLTGAERTIPTVHLHISHVTPARHAQGALSILRALVACALVAQIAVFVLFGAL